MDDVSSLKIDNSGNIYVGGDFVVPPGYASDTYIAKWNSSVWEHVGGVTEKVERMTNKIIGKFVGRCTHCGVKYCDDEKFCEGCGAPV